jgi:sugar lactone lactonase YvrE
MDSARRDLLIRLTFALVLVLTISPIVSAYLSFSDSNTVSPYEAEAERPFSERAQVVPPADNTTVVSTQGTASKGAKDGEIVAFAPDGRVLYHNDTYRTYWDIDPVPGRAIPSCTLQVLRFGPMAVQ